MNDFDEESLDYAELPVYTSRWEQDVDEAEYVASQEEYELQQLVEAMEQEDRENDASSQHFGSDDEDFDAVFMECEQQFQPHQYQQQQQSQDPHQNLGGGDVMDAEMMEF